MCEVRLTLHGQNVQPACGKKATFKARQTWPHSGVTRDVLLCDEHAAAWGRLVKV
jgi:hypothetical protein